MTKKSVRNILSTRKSAHIASIIDNGLNLEGKIEPSYTALFGFEKEFNYILEILAKNGPLNESELAEIGENYSISRHQIRRRIYGTSKILSLKENDFITLVTDLPQRTRRKQNIFGLSFKGVLATIPRVNFQDNYNIQKYYGFVREHIGNEFDIIVYSMLYAKYQIAFVLYWHNMTGRNINRNKEFRFQFLDGVINNMLFGGLFIKSNEEKREACFKIAKRFLVLRDVLGLLIDKIYSNKNSIIYSNLDLFPVSNLHPQITDKLRAKIILESLTLDWAFNLARSCDFPSIFNRFKIPLYEKNIAGNTFSWEIARKEMNDLGKNILNEMGIKKKYNAKIIRNFALKPIPVKKDDSLNYWPVYASS